MRKILVWLALIAGLSAAGCEAIGHTKVPPEPTVDVTPGVVHVGEPTEIHLAESVGCFYGQLAEGNVLVGQTKLDGEIHPAVVDLATGEAYQVNAGGIRLAPGPVRYLAQVEDRDPHTDQAGLVVYDLEQGRYIDVAEGRIWSPVTSGNLVVWEEVHPESRGIYGYDLAKEQQFVVTETVEGAAGFPYVSEDWVVYLFYPPREFQVPQLRAYQISTDEDVLIGTLGVGMTEHDPTALFDVDGGRVVWRVRRSEIHVYDLEARVEEMVFKDEEPAVVLSSLDIAGDLVMWADGPRGRVGYDLVDRRLFEIPDLPDDVRVSSKSVLISESYVVWLVEEVDPRKIQMLTPPPPGVPTPTPPDPAVEVQQCRPRRLFVAPIVRQ